MATVGMNATWRNLLAWGLITLSLMSATSLSLATTLSRVEGLRLSAQDISRDYETKIIYLNGEVEIAFEDQVLKCDKATIDQSKGEIQAEGNVLLASRDTVIEGTKILYNYRTKLGKIEDGLVQSGQVIFEGALLEKTGENTYFGKQARYTSCKTCPPGWSFSGQEIDAEIGGYAYIKYPILRIADFPIFILPRILIPLKSDRQSGLLVPTFDFSKKAGVAFTQSYFWAISRSKDMTFSAQQAGRRGFKSLMEYRYVLAPGSSGNFRGAFIRDRTFTVAGSPKNEDTEFILPRGYFQYRHHYQLPENITQRMQITYLTDIRYPRDFAEELQGQGEPALESNLSLTQNTEGQHRSIEGAYYINLLKNYDPSSSSDQNGDALSRNDDAVHRWPEVKWNFTDQTIGDSNLYWGLDFNYVHFIRRDFSYDDISGDGDTKTVNSTRDGTFSPATDLIRTGHRTIFEPKLYYPFRLAKHISLTPLIKYNEAQYRFTAEEITASSYTQNAARRYVQTDLNLQTSFQSIFGGKSPNENLYKHEIIPEVVYSHIPWVERPDHPFFGRFENQPYSRSAEAVSTDDFFYSSSDVSSAYSEYSGIQFDYRDRLFDKELYTFRLSNNWVRKRPRGDTAEYDKIAHFRMEQSYDVLESRRNYPQPWSPLHSLLDVRLQNFETHTVASMYPYADNLVNWSSRVRFKGDMGAYLEITYAEKAYVNSRQEASNKTKNLGTGTGFQTKYMNFTGKVNFNMISDEFEGWEYIALFKPPGDCWTIKFGHRKTVGSDDQYKFSVNFEFGGV